MPANAGIFAFRHSSLHSASQKIPPLEERGGSVLIRDAPTVHPFSR